MLELLELTLAAVLASASIRSIVDDWRVLHRSRRYQSPSSSRRASRSALARFDLRPHP